MKMLFLITQLIFTVSTFAQSAADNKPILQVGQATLVKKSLLAMPQFQFFGNPGVSTKYVETGKTLFDVLKNDLEISGYFTFIDSKAYLEDPNKTGLKPVTVEPNGFNFENWKQISADFLIRAGYNIKANSIDLEVYLYHVPSSKLLLGKKYQGETKNARYMAHRFANDILLSLTGKKGFFVSKLAVTSDRGGKDFKELYVMDWDAFEGSIKQITNNKSVTISPSWSTDGKKVAYSAMLYKPKLKMRNVDLLLHDLASGSSTVISDDPGTNSGVNFHPDGKSLLFTNTRKTGHPDIFRYYFDNKKLIKITAGPLGAMNVEPYASPDGRRILFSSDRSGGHPMIYVMDINGGNVNRLTFAGRYNSTPAWSPDGKLIVFAGQENDHFDIFLMNADGTNMIRLTSSPKRGSSKLANNEDPSFSPDGRNIVFRSNRTGSYQIFLVNLDGSVERRLTFDNFNYEKPVWSPFLD